MTCARPLLVFALAFTSGWASACGARQTSSTGNGTGDASASGDAGGPLDAAAPVPVPSLEVLAARAARDAPGMRERARLDPAPARSDELVGDAGADTCLRVVFGASRPVRVRLADGRGVSRGEAATGTEGLVPPLGPACTTRGDGLHLVVEASAPTVTRAIVLASP